ncbi:conserved hypothetical protein [Candidatus Competibacter denitrificans Run_A_D11]|uniref:PD-(D/E)XK endonuclease-like domain-containing protein n=1 Tax=Candidatus Competibacter denitrificans Run_A_D11 TaxID=1400863 RepID=W6M8L3_9GAMM|nr:PD-(D/E)XK nuclease family protein [Candidatus Competibacter denitrificans]CDI04321.1 conserved hypothetical protein [Candidatus Competibacter denitrificans Run_A_D11]
MSNGTWLIVALVIGFALVLLSRRRGKRAAWLQREHMPDVLKTATLIASERLFRCEHPVALSGTPDQVYRLRTGSLVVVDTKRRRRVAVYDADIAQVSTYRVLLQSQSRFRHQSFAEYGYLRLVTPAGVRYERVSLWTPEQVIQLHRRYWTLREGLATPLGATFAGLCRQCGHRQRCGQARSASSSSAPLPEK